ncbi:hypothetical protein DYB32_008657 [Aphanomyces invadans]|uniref:Secreted protein n=1 Tax=Aphanomyces invadans TaxID=157072 RepID=A0A3R6ZJR7_9STRA|nr:hypothetical protein DYB32_008657 [Aphanomyces invadans]
MIRLVALLGAACLAAAQNTAPTYTPPPTPVAWSMKKIRTVQARVQSSPPVWDANQKAFVANFKNLSPDPTFRWQASLDTVNTASVEGALFYVQSEGIGTDVDNACARKTNMTYIWFYDINIVQPYFAVAEYGTNTGVVPEYGAFVAMDNGMCTLRESNPPEQCLQFSGINYNPNLGPYVGGEPRKTHPKAVYDDNVWFSFPGPCFLKPFDQKTATCRNDPSLKGGMCPRGTKPDGVTCTYSFDVLGYLSIDDLVGITSLPVPGSTTQNFTDRVQFCKAGGIEYNFDTQFSNLTFWKDPLNVTANAERTKKMMTMYADIVKAGKGAAANFKPLPNVTDLTAENPPCYVNNILCYQNAFGCKRRLLAQVCELCTADGPDCVKKPANAAPFPTLVKQFVPPKPTLPNGKPATGGNGTPGTSAATSSIAGIATLVIVALSMLG